MTPWPQLELHSLARKPPANVRVLVVVLIAALPHVCRPRAVLSVLAPASPVWSPLHKADSSDPSSVQAALQVRIAAVVLA